MSGRHLMREPKKSFFGCKRAPPRGIISPENSSSNHFLESNIPKLKRKYMPGYKSTMRQGKVINKTYRFMKHNTCSHLKKKYITIPRIITIKSISGLMVARIVFMALWRWFLTVIGERSSFSAIF